MRATGSAGALFARIDWCRVDAVRRPQLAAPDGRRSPRRLRSRDVDVDQAQAGGDLLLPDATGSFYMDAGMRDICARHSHVVSAESALIN